MRVTRKVWSIWLSLVTASFAVLEGVALLDGVPGNTLTAFLVWLLPAWVAAMGLGWVAWHFGSAYILRALGRWHPR